MKESSLVMKMRIDENGNERELIVVPEKYRDQIKSFCNDTSGHLGIVKTKDSLAKYFNWPNCFKEMEELKKVPFSIATDGSNKGDFKLYPQLVTFHNEENQKNESSLLSTSALVGDNTGVNIANQWIEIWDIPCEIIHPKCILTPKIEHTHQVSSKSDILGCPPLDDLEWNGPSNNIPLENCLALSADNAPVMIGKKTGVEDILSNEIKH
ncbi:hypothetical protein AVEN_109155-1 [Araneus ventricosus]|uniref:Integrase zinc-binding domain-containing protein n=1 Tax=Araneus ventricosus TaxID=182803 RepID=A0A4Y2IW53_ARAVE|nr:hypothetical protein AVEN_109155-1 [Araneus ventricosus]